MFDGVRLVERDADGVGVDRAEVDFFGVGGGVDFGGIDAGDGECVEDRFGVELGISGAEALREERGEGVDVAGDFFEAFGAVIDGIHRCHDGEENLGRADVGRRLVAADVLLAGAEGEAHRGITLGVLGNADEAAGHLAFEGVFGGEETGMRAAETHGHAEALRGADGDIGAEFSGGAEQGEREQIGGDDGERAGGVGGGEEFLEVVDAAGRVGILHEHAEGGGGGRGEGFVVADDDLDAEGNGAGFDDVDRLRVALFGDEKRAVSGGVAFLEAVAHHHGLGGGGAFVEHGGVGDFEPGEVGDERLEIEERFEAALGNLGLIRRVGGIPAGVFKNGALDDAGGEGVVIAEADVAAENLIMGGKGAELGERGAFAGGGGQVHRAAADVGRHGGIDEGVERWLADDGEHRGLFGGIGAVVAAGEGIGRSEEIRERSGGGGGGRGSGHKKRR